MKPVLLISAIMSISASVNAITLVEDFSETFPAWESGWLGLNTNIQNYFGVGSGLPGNFLWIADNDALRGLGETVDITFGNAFGSSLTSFSIDIDTFVSTSIQVYDGSGGILLDSSLNIDLGYEHISVLSANGISGFSLFSADQIEGNTAIDNVIVTTNTVPVPAAIWLFISGLISLAVVIRRKAFGR